MHRRTDQLEPGDRVTLRNGIVRTVDRITPTDYTGTTGLPIVAVYYAEGRTDEWSEGNTATSETLWTVEPAEPAPDPAPLPFLHPCDTYRLDGLPEPEPEHWPMGHLIILEGDGLPRKLARCDCGGMSATNPSHRLGPITDSLTAGRILAGRDPQTGAMR